MLDLIAAIRAKYGISAAPPPQLTLPLCGRSQGEERGGLDRPARVARRASGRRAERYEIAPLPVNPTTVIVP